eukprot:CAMPEP_0168452212 /NCGR_PEP_ID=MMETSP0228-20121227/49035_1 /TAXON_ID=133427 /ORGANISM="Protoceratium reticulatum, Strain CCCM 535 (=CCMP 1889)" /LENGTH=900 /DNA_ID=CAMNT_0008466853 /DNA_START=164 /DNA_END=2866 /DNA_ORIENTATION=-
MEAFVRRAGALIAVAGSASCAGDQGPADGPCTLDLSSARQKWTLCWPDPRYGGCSSSFVGIPARVPGTVLGSMLDTNFSGLDPYDSMNLHKIPDIHQVGRAFYTVVYRTQAPAAVCGRGNRTLLLRGVNYAVQVTVNSEEVASSVGMFRRIRVPVPAHAFMLEIMVEPPFHPGVNVSGQGGNHDLAKDGPLTQFALGWDWVQATPDRHTGLWDRVLLLEHKGQVLQDVYVRTKIRFRQGGADAAELAPEAAAGPCGLQWRVRHHLNRSLDAAGALRTPGCAGSSALLQQAELWWPWQHGKPHLYTLEVLQEGELVLQQQFGIRSSEVVYNTATDGPAFQINGQLIFLAGANWITTDQLLRFAADAQRYESEVRLLRDAGVNIIRVWGGGIAERPEFFAACDRFGMLVYQEFWMTGDNNGQQAGELSWPLDHGVFVENARDTVLLLRGHPSLFWWGGGNELFPTDLSPPPDIRDAVRAFVEELDGSRPYIQTSALLQQMDSYRPSAVEAALGVDDGPYQAQAPREFFERNPCLRFTVYPNRSGLAPFPLSINPEVGGPNWPTYSGLKKFITTNVSPSRKGKLLPPEFAFHNFEAFTIDMTLHRPNFTNNYTRTEIDPIYDLFGDNRIMLDLETYSNRANLVQYVQYRSLFEGYLQHQWEWYAGVLLWKAQTPWPSLRGFVYDWYLEANAAHAGMRMALQHLDHVQVSLGGCRDGEAGLFRVNRGWDGVQPVGVEAAFHGLPGGERAAEAGCEASAVRARGVGRVCGLRWPTGEGAFLLRLRYGRQQQEYILSDPCNDDALVPAMDFRNLDEHGVCVSVELHGGRQNRVVVSNRGTRVALLVHPRLFDASGTEVLPVHWNADFFNLLPGESQVLTWEGRPGRVEVSGFNTRTGICGQESVVI